MSKMKISLKKFCLRPLSKDIRPFSWNFSKIVRQISSMSEFYKKFNVGETTLHIFQSNIPSMRGGSSSKFSAPGGAAKPCEESGVRIEGLYGDPCCCPP